MTTKKTIALVDLIDRVNEMNRGSSCPPAIRDGWNSLLESVLMDANAYHGFGYVTSEQLIDGAAGQLPGVVHKSLADGGTTFPDETRRVYYTSPKLRTKIKS